MATKTIGLEIYLPGNSVVCRPNLKLYWLWRFTKTAESFFHPNAPILFFRLSPLSPDTTKGETPCLGAGNTSPFCDEYLSCEAY